MKDPIGFVAFVVMAFSLGYALCDVVQSRRRRAAEKATGGKDAILAGLLADAEKVARAGNVVVAAHIGGQVGDEHVDPLSIALTGKSLAEVRRYAEQRKQEMRRIAGV